MKPGGRLPREPCSESTRRRANTHITPTVRGRKGAKGQAAANLTLGIQVERHPVLHCPCWSPSPLLWEAKPAPGLGMRPRWRRCPGRQDLVATGSETTGGRLREVELGLGLGMNARLRRTPGRASSLRVVSSKGWVAVEAQALGVKVWWSAGWRLGAKDGLWLYGDGIG